MRLARERTVGGLVLRSPFTSLADVAAVHYPFLPVRLLLRDRFPVREQVAGVGVPVVVVAGGADAAGATVVEVAGARHNDPELSHGPAVVDAVVRVNG